MPNPWNGHEAKVLTCPDLGDAHPAAGVLVFLAVAVPVELDFDAGVFVGVDLFTGGADDDSGLGTGDFGLNATASALILETTTRT